MGSRRSERASSATMARAMKRIISVSSMVSAVRRAASAGSDRRVNPAGPTVRKSVPPP